MPSFSDNTKTETRNKMKINDTIYEYKGYKATISTHHDEDMGEPWKEDDGCGIVSDWTRRDKAPGERVLCFDRGNSRFYDWAGTVALAKKYGWGLGDEAKAKLAQSLGHEPTHGEITAEAVRLDFEHLRSWCNDEWHWQGYTTAIETPDGEVITTDSCWGFESTDDDYMLDQAKSHARHEIDARLATVEQTQIAECVP
jgi:hypothetical protein